MFSIDSGPWRWQDFRIMANLHTHSDISKYRQIYVKKALIEIANLIACVVLSYLLGAGLMLGFMLPAGYQAMPTAIQMGRLMHLAGAAAVSIAFVTSLTTIAKAAKRLIDQIHDPIKARRQDTWNYLLGVGTVTLAVGMAIPLGILLAAPRPRALIAIK